MKAATEKYGTKMKPGMDSEAGIQRLYDEKLKKMTKVIKAEQKRLGIDTDW
ncbi:hypothetical protein [Nocardia iowensis]|uniref:Uncharacterized protein n=1 Tax=Nocardia iowensis TaxID=204891 RepID=A0ABX8RK82_NOCIO|nr:hypothetical protein [Nocardia iowensis]QXN89998.1 hypothetical protein KV110_31820 [Nocardia iowensis]